MKILHREDVDEAGYELPNTGICANMAEFDLEELKYAGEWVLADDEVVVADKCQQLFLYTVVSGQVDVYKRNDKSSQHQHIANIAPGDAFGEMAFLSGGVASADVQATGQAILWRIDHEQLLEFVGQHRSGGQLCLNVASILSNRLVAGNSKLVDLGKKLQDSMRELQSASKNSKALKQMQHRVTGVTRAFAGKEVSKTQLGGLGIAAVAVAGLSLIGLIISLATRPDGDAVEKLATLKDENENLARTHGKLVVQQQGLLNEKGKLQSRLDKSLNDQNQLVALVQQNNAGASKEILDKLDSFDNREQTAGLPERPTPPVPQPVPAPPVRPPVRPPPPPPTPVQPSTPRVSSSQQALILAWAQRWSTVAFPAQVRAVSSFDLQAAGSSGAKVPVRAGSTIYAIRASGDRLQVGLKRNLNTFTQVVPVGATNFIEVITPYYNEHQKRLGKRQANTPTKGTPFTATPKRPNPSNKPNTKPSAPANDHGSSCVCKDCRKKKKGGSLFPDLPGQ